MSPMPLTNASVNTSAVLRDSSYRSMKEAQISASTLSPIEEQEAGGVGAYNIRLMPLMKWSARGCVPGLTLFEPTCQAEMSAR